jgi:hypothetical protein
VLALAVLGTPKAFAEGTFDENLNPCLLPGLKSSELCSASESSAVAGTWLYTVSIPVPDQEPFVFLGTETYTPGGTYTEADQLSFTPGYLATPGHGGWQSAGGRNFLLTYVNLTYDDQGASGTSKVRQVVSQAMILTRLPSHFSALLNQISHENHDPGVKVDRYSDDVATGPGQNFGVDEGAEALSCDNDSRSSGFE